MKNKTLYQEWAEEKSKEPDGNVHAMKVDIGVLHEESKDCWCEPELIEDATENGGVKCYLHKETQ